jgi:MFS family permease
MSQNSEIIKVTSIAALGTYFEWYDNFIATTAAAIVWPVVFFAGAGEAMGYALSMASFGATYIVRPIGAYIFGHVGDKYGRRTNLLFCILLMGIGIGGIAILPQRPTLSLIQAIVLLFILRILFGIGLGGEFGGGVSWIAEFARNSKHRGFYTSWMNGTIPLGTLTASAAFLWSQQFSGQQFLIWGWRLPFYVGTVLIIVGVLIRYAFAESPMFKELTEKRQILKLPASHVLKEKWKVIILCALSFLPGYVLTPTMTALFGQAYESAIGIPSSLIFIISIYSSIAFLVGIVGGSLISDKYGRKKAVWLGYGGSLVLIYPYYLLLTTGNIMLITIGWIVYSFVTFIGSAGMTTLLAESFETRFRASGSGLAYQLAALTIGVILVFVYPVFLALGHGVVGSGIYITTLGFALIAIGLIALWPLEETFDKPLK